MGVAGTAAAMETADITLLTNDLGRLPERWRSETRVSSR